MADGRCFVPLLRRERVTLLENIRHHDNLFWDHLIEKGVIEPSWVTNNKAKYPAPSDQTREFLDYLETKTQKEFTLFCEALKKTNQAHIAENLKNEGETGVVELEISFSKLNISSDLVKELVEAQKIYAKKLRMNAEQSMSGETVDTDQCTKLLHLIREIETTKRKILSVEYKCIVIRVKCEDAEALTDLQNKITSGLLHQLLIKDMKSLGLLEKYAVPEDDLDKISIGIPCEQQDKALAALTPVAAESSVKPSEEELVSRKARDANKTSLLQKAPVQDPQEIIPDRQGASGSGGPGRQDTYQCTKCDEPLTTTKRLKCSHKYCHSCLTWLSQREARDRICCEVCGKETPIPVLGVEGLKPVYLGTAQKK